MIPALLPFLLMAAAGAPPVPYPERARHPGRPDPVLTPEQEVLVQAALRAARASGKDASHIVVHVDNSGEIVRIEVADNAVWRAPRPAPPSIPPPGPPGVARGTEFRAERAPELAFPAPSAWRPPARDPGAADRIAAAQARRERKAEKRRREVAAGGWGRTSS